MPQNLRANYPVLTFTVATLVVFGLIKLIVSPFLGPVAINSLIGQDAVFLKQGATEPVNWQVLTADSLAKAKREDKPILLFMGTGWSAAARRIDKEVFLDASVARYLTRNFVCIRLDLDAHPDWLSTFLPVTRIQLAVNPICQMWVLSPSGKLISPIERSNLWSIGNAQRFLDQLIAIERTYRNAESAELQNQLVATPIGSAQASDIQAINSTSGLYVSTDSLVNLISVGIQNPPSAQLQLAQYQTIMPEGWSFVMLVNGPVAAQKLIDPLLKSPVVNWIDGGFFWGSSGTQWKVPVYDQPAVPNAEMALFLARLSALSNNPLDRYLAEQTIHGLLRDFLAGDGLLETARIGTESFRTFRSGRYSFDPRKLRTIFPNYQDRQWAWNNFGLRVENNPLMVPYVASPDQVLSQPSILESHIEKMRANALPSIFDTAESADVNGVAAENLIQATRILEDSTSNAAATTIFEKLGTLVVGSDVSHFRVPQPGAHPMLSDYLAYSAAALADYENLGRVNSLLEGQRVLQRAFQIFPAASFPGLLCTSGDTPLRDKFANSSSPQLADDVGESCTSLIIRLGHDYGNLLQNSSDHKLARLAKSWLQISLRLSQSVISTAQQLGPNAGGIYNARALIQDGRFAITVGKNPTSMAQSVVQQSPLFLVAPAIGPVWPSLQSKAAGVYVFSNGHFVGPLTVANASALLNLQGNR